MWRRLLEYFSQAMLTKLEKERTGFADTLKHNLDARNRDALRATEVTHWTLFKLMSFKSENRRNVSCSI